LVNLSAFGKEISRFEVLLALLSFKGIAAVFLLDTPTALFPYVDFSEFIYEAKFYPRNDIEVALFPLYF
jgi:hypothetical protein